MKVIFNNNIFMYLLFLAFGVTGCALKNNQISYYTPEKASGILIELDNDLNEVWRSKEYNKPVSYTKCKNGDRLISDAYTNYIYRVDNDNNIRWMYPSNGNAYVREAQDGRYLVSFDAGDNNVKEIDNLGHILWSMNGETSRKEAIKIYSNKYLIANWKDKSLTMYDSEKNVLWQNKGEIYPSSVQVLDDDEYLISDAEHYKVIKINQSGDILWAYSETRGKPFVARQIGANRIIIGYKGLPLIKVIDNSGKQIDVIKGVYAEDIKIMPDGHIGIAGLIDDKVVNKNAPSRY